MKESAANQPVLNQLGSDPAVLNLRDIHLPEAISWWPIASGWWIIFVGLVALLISLFIARKLYLNKQLNRDIKAELDNIKQQFQQTKNKPQLAKSLSILLRRASISFYPNTDIAGLTGESWLNHLDSTFNPTSADKKKSPQFKSKVGETLLSAPYLPVDSELNFDAPALIKLCESWLLASHKLSARTAPSQGSYS